MSNFKKIAVQVLPGMAPIGGKKPTHTTDVGVTRVRPTGGISTSGRPTKEEQEQVMRMQQIMAAFGGSIDANPGNLASRLELSPDEEEKISGAIRNTGAGTQTPFDGVWGEKTIQALNLLSGIASKLSTQSINPGKDYKSVKPENIIAAAKGNVDAIADLMKAVGFGSAVPATAGVRAERYDIIPQTLSPDNINTQSTDGISVRPAHLDNIWNFYSLVKSIFADLSALASESNSKLTKVAKIIVDSNIIKISQDGSTAGQAAGAGMAWEKSRRQQITDPSFDKRFEEVMEARQAEKDKQSKGVSVAKFDAAINWFLQRSNRIYQMMEDWYQSGATKQNDKGQDIPLATEEDVKAAKEYHNSILKLSRNWEAQRNNFIQDGQDAKIAMVDPKSLIQYKNVDKMFGKEDVGVARERGVSHKQNAKDIVNTDSSQYQPQGGVSISSELPDGPISSDLYISDLYKYIDSNGTAGSEAMKSVSWLQENLKRNDFNINVISRMSPANIVDAYRANPQKNARAFATNVPYAIQQILNNVYNSWVEDLRLRVGKNPGQDLMSNIQSLVNKQSSLLNAWNTALSRKTREGKNWVQGASKDRIDLD